MKYLTRLKYLTKKTIIWKNCQVVNEAVEAWKISSCVDLELYHYHVINAVNVNERKNENPVA